MAATILSTLTAAGETAGSNATKDNSKNGTVNKAISRCMRAWNYAYNKETAELDEDDNDFDAKEVANEAYLRATPPLSGYQNICDFIACINHASLIDILSPDKARHYLANAKIAITAICHQPKPVSEHFDRRPKASAKEEK